MQLYFIRHAQSANNYLWDQTRAAKGRSDDPELTEMGCKQAELVAAFVSRFDPSGLARWTNDAAADADPSTRDNSRALTWAQMTQNVHGFGLTHIYASLMIRAMATGSAIARACALRLVALEDLHEAGGIYHEDETSNERIGRGGQTRSYFATNFPDCDLPDCVTDEGWWNRPWESPEMRTLRAKRLWDDLFARHGASDDRVAIVSHGAFYNYLLAAILNLPDPEASRHWFEISNCGITRLDVSDGRVGVRYMNRVDYLPPDLIT